jgi:poly-gamma-glutamate synthesis protein (capsule biosynthesis protein)
LNKKLFPVISGLMLVSMILGACSNGAGSQTATSTIVPTLVPKADSLWIDPVLPAEVAKSVSSVEGVALTDDRSTASLELSISQGNVSDAKTLAKIQWVYALEARFPTLTDDLPLDTLKRIWQGNTQEDDPLNTIQVSEETRAVLDELWGKSDTSAVVTVPESTFETNDFSQPKTWAIVPFDQIAPRWKVIRVDGLSPIDKPLDVEKYALTVSFTLAVTHDTGASEETAKKLITVLPASNRDETKMTVLMMTGTTAITRAIAYKMEIKGLDYPILAVKPWFENADLVHVSNEISFNPDCPFPDAYQHGLQFCASPKYIETLKDIGVNVVEVTGNHENDYGPEYFVDTLKTYKDLGWAVFGGGLTPEEARQPVKLEVNGNKIAFIGCNVAGPTSDWVTEDRAGSAVCDMNYIHDQIKQLKSQGYVVITTFQHYEVYVYMYGEMYAKDFQDAAVAGADIVNGSQAHYAMGMEFMDNSFIHYGLGNFLFDQMSYDVVGEQIRREFIDRHIIYNGKYISTELKTALLTDWAQPVPMTQQDRVSFLQDIFTGSHWK